MRAEILITGGAGFIGSHTAEYALRLGHKVSVIDDLSSGTLSNLSTIKNDIEFFKGSILNKDTLRKALQKKDIVIHLAAVPSVERSVRTPLKIHAVNVSGALGVMHAVVRAGVKRIIFASSSAIYGDPAILPLKETMLPSPKSPYGAGKAACELYLQSFSACFGIETIALRYFNIYGPKQDPEGEYAAVIPRFISRMLKKQAPVIYGDGSQTRDFLYVEDAARANILACSAAARACGQAYNIASGSKLDLISLVSYLNKLCGISAQAIHEQPRAGDIKDSYANADAAHKQLQWKPLFTIQQGLAKTVEYYSSNNISAP